MYTLEKSLAQWEEAGEYGTTEDRLARAALWQPFYTRAAQAEQNQPAALCQQAVAVAEYL